MKRFRQRANCDK